MSIFKNRKLEVKLVKDEATTNEILSTTTPAEMAAIAAELGKKIVIGTVVVIAATVILTAASEIAVSKLK